MTIITVILKVVKRIEESVSVNFRFISIDQNDKKRLLMMRFFSIDQNDKIMRVILNAGKRIEEAACLCEILR